MTASGVNGNGNGARSGTRALTLLATPLIVTVLRKLADEPKRLVDLRRECHSPAQTTMRAHLKELEELGVVARQRRDRFPGALEYRLEPAGKDLLFVADVVERWLLEAPEGSLELGSEGAKAAIKALVEGWSSTMLRALAARPMSLTELDNVISTLNYPSLERRLSAMRMVGQIEARPSKGAGTPYIATTWLRRGIAPITAATRWERSHASEQSAPITRIDTEAGFLLAIPLLRLSEDVDGSCRMGVEMSNGRERRLAGVLTHVERGRVASCTVRLNGQADAWATGPVSGWFHATIASDLDRLELGGDQRLARALLEGLHEVLFGPARQMESTSRAQV